MATFWMILRFVVMALPYITAALGPLVAAKGAENEALLSSGAPEYANYDKAKATRFGTTQKHAGMAMVVLGLAGIPATRKYHETHPLTPAAPVVPFNRNPGKPPAPNPNDAASASIIAARQKILDNQAAEDAAIKTQRDAEDAARHNDIEVQLQHLDDVLASRKGGA